MEKASGDILDIIPNPHLQKSKWGRQLELDGLRYVKLCHCLFFIWLPQRQEQVNLWLIGQSLPGMPPRLVGMQ
ncbi:hypothetical protein [Gibbsiella quercinecans]|uniref:hypothetical protein n=1 Tax=Gibbsiella quercinecans TaxID=929813 RepID=UPI003A4DED42